MTIIGCARSANRIEPRCWDRREAESVAASQQCDLATVNAAAARKQWRHGFLPVEIDYYLDLLDRAARAIAKGEWEAIDARAEPILSRLGLSPSMLFEALENFDRWFHRASGSASNLADEAGKDT